MSLTSYYIITSRDFDIAGHNGNRKVVKQHVKHAHVLMESANGRTGLVSGRNQALVASLSRAATVGWNAAWSCVALICIDVTIHKKEVLSDPSLAWWLVICRRAPCPCPYPTNLKRYGYLTFVYTFVTFSI